MKLKNFKRGSTKYENVFFTVEYVRSSVSWTSTHYRGCMTVYFSLYLTFRTFMLLSDEIMHIN